MLTHANRRPAIFLRHQRLLAVVLLAVALAGRDELAAQRGAAPETRAPYTERISGTLVTFEMMPVPAGTVQLPGVDAPVAIAPLWVASTEVTWDLYDVFVFGLDRPAGSTPDSATLRAGALARPSTPYVLPGDAYGHQGYPALGMSFLAAQALARWVSAKTGHTYRVPTQAEWIHVCRAGRSDPPAGTALATRAWFAGNAEDQTHPVGALPPNAHGVHDMLGNAAEWVVAGTDSVVMGGGFSSEASDVGCTTSRRQTPSWNSSDPQLPRSRWWLTDAFFVGVRLVRE